jgi:hypothetical protein
MSRALLRIGRHWRSVALNPQLLSMDQKVGGSSPSEPAVPCRAV